MSAKLSCSVSYSQFGWSELTSWRILKQKKIGSLKVAKWLQQTPSNPTALRTWFSRSKRPNIRLSQTSGYQMKTKKNSVDWKNSTSPNIEKFWIAQLVSSWWFPVHTTWGFPARKMGVPLSFRWILTGLERDSTVGWCKNPSYVG